MRRYRVHLYVPVRFTVDVKSETPFEAIKEAETQLDRIDPFSTHVTIDDGAPWECGAYNLLVTEAIVDPYVWSRDVEASQRYQFDDNQWVERK